MTSNDLVDLLTAALRAALKASGSILKVYETEFGVHSKEDRSPITEADRLSHLVIANELPRVKRKWHIHLLSEEGKDIPFSERKKWNYYWLIDPLDGTKEFIKRNGEFTVNIALMEKNRALLGVVYAPVFDLLYFGFRGIGSYKLERFASEYGGIPGEISAKLYPELIKRAEKLGVADRGNHDPGHKKTKITVAVSRSHRGSELDDFIRKLKYSYSEVELITCGSALKICFVAEGKADIYPRFGPTMEWDTAAAHMIVNGAGKKLCSMHSEEELEYNKEDLRNDSFIALPGNERNIFSKGQFFP